MANATFYMTYYYYILLLLLFILISQCCSHHVHIYLISLKPGKCNEGGQNLNQNLDIMIAIDTFILLQDCVIAQENGLCIIPNSR